jgi:hypothetical protein
LAENEPKKPGLQNVAELKKRLGVKTGVMQAVAPVAEPAAPNLAPPGIAPGPDGRRTTVPPVVAPPILAPPIAARPAIAQVAVPPPPGFQPPAPPPPDLRRDPFAVAAPAVAVPAVQDFVVVDRGEKIEGLQKKTPFGKILRIVGIVAVIFGVGYWLGRIWGARHEHNYAIDAAGQMLGAIDQMGTARGQIKQAFTDSKTRMAGQSLPANLPDDGLTTALGALNFQPPDPKLLYAQNYQFLDSDVTQEAILYYITTEKLANAISAHVTRSQTDQQLLDAYVKSLKDAAAAAANGGQGSDASQLGIVFDTTKPFSVGLLAEVGQSGCSDGSTDCGPDKLEFQIRTDVGSAWDTRSPALTAKDAQRVVLLDKTTALFQSTVRGGPTVTAVINYQARITEIAQYYSQLDTMQTDLDKKLGDAAGQPKLIVF